MTYFPLKDVAERAREVRETVTGDALPAYDRMIASLDPARVAALQDKYREELQDFDPIGIYKYADLPFWLARSIMLARRLGLDTAPPCRILDIGMGPGHLAAVAQALGHRVTGTDISVPFYDDVADALGVDRRIAPVERGKPHPDVGGPFDRILIVWQVFDYIREYPDGSRDYWPVEDWALLLRDLARNHAAADGTIHLELNPHLQAGKSIFDAPLMDFCEDHGATVDRAFGIVDLPVAGLRQDAAGRRHSPALQAGA